MCQPARPTDSGGRSTVSPSADDLQQAAEQTGRPGVQEGEDGKRGGRAAEDQGARAVNFGNDDPRPPVEKLQTPPVCPDFAAAAGSHGMDTKLIPHGSLHPRFPASMSHDGSLYPVIPHNTSDNTDSTDATKQGGSGSTDATKQGDVENVFEGKSDTVFQFHPHAFHACPKCG